MKFFTILGMVFISYLSYAQCTERCESGDCTNGYGVYTFKSCEKYDGNWINDMRSGFGTNYFKNGDKYVGEWSQNKRNGYGTNYYADGSASKAGYWKDDIYLGTTNTSTSGNVTSGSNCTEKCESGDCTNGYGVYTFKSCEKYDGNWSNDMRNGFGTNYFKNGDKYVGEWKENKRNGYGTNYYADGSPNKAGYWNMDVYLGTSNTTNTSTSDYVPSGSCTEKCESGDCTNGYGVYVFKSCEKYDGNWKNDMRNGFGTNYFKSGDKYVGEWKDNKRNGYGTNYYADGSATKAGYWNMDVYLGTTNTDNSSVNNTSTSGNCVEKCESGDCTNGYGTYVFKSCEKYEGYWKNDMRNGFGTNYFANGTKYIGEWKDNKRNGYGTNYPTDAPAKTGYWVDDIYQGATK